MNSEGHLLLSNDTDSILDNAEDGRRHRFGMSPVSLSRFLILSTIVNISMFAFCIFLMVAPVSPSFLATRLPGHQVGPEPAEPYSPANPIIEYEYRAINPNDTRFMGPPGPVWEEHMHELMEGTLIRISEDELRLYGSDSVPLKDGGYAAGLGIAHNLHCVKKLKKFLYRDYYEPQWADGESNFEDLRLHADHCLDFLRQSVLCHLDYSMYTLYWAERKDIPKHHDPGLQKCVNWSKLQEWMQSRAANTDMLVKPWT